MIISEVRYDVNRRLGWRYGWKMAEVRGRRRVALTLLSKLLWHHYRLTKVTCRRFWNLHGFVHLLHVQMRSTALITEKFGSQIGDHVTQSMLYFREVEIRIIFFHWHSDSEQKLDFFSFTPLLIGCIWEKTERYNGKSDVCWRDT